MQTQETVGLILAEIRDAARFRWPAMASAWAICLVGWAAILLLPNKYEATTRIFVDTRTALSSVIQGLAIQGDMEAYLSLAKESLLGDTQIQQLIDQTTLRAKANTPRARAKLADKLRGDIQVNALAAGDRNQPGGVVYSVSYRDADRNRSLRVVQILLDSFRGTVVGGKRQGSQTAEDFLSGQIRDNEQRLREAEQRLAAFKKRNVGVMPGVEGDYFTRLQNEMDLNAKARTSLSVAMSRREELLKQRTGEAPLAIGGAAGSVAAVGGAAGRSAQSTDTGSMIADAQRRLAALLLRYTDKHPDVQAVREEIASLEERRTREVAALRQGDPDALIASGAGASPIYQSIQLGLNQVDVQIAELRGEIAQHSQKIAQLQQLVNSVPEVEAEFSRLNRDYEVTRAQYAALVDRLKKARLGQDAEEASAIRFEVIDPPSVEFRPVSPDRPRLVILVFALSLLAGIGLAFGLSKLRPVFSSSSELYAATGLPVLGEVQSTTLAEELVAARRSYFRYSLGAVGLAIAFGGVLWLNLTYTL